MIWLTWRQFRGGAVTMAAALAVLAVVLGMTGPGLADDYSTGIAACTTGSGGCSGFVERFFDDNLIPFLAVTAVVLVLPALIGVFWGAPLIARELEAGTHRLVWNQSITRTRWLAVKLGLPGLAAMTAAGLGSLAATWWSSPLDKATDDFPRLEPLLFAARGIVPVGYAAFAFALGVTVGMLVRRTLPAMAITLAVFVAGQIAMPLLVRPHLLTPTHSTIEITASNVSGFHWANDDLLVEANAVSADAWVLSSHILDPSGHSVDVISVPSSSGPCASPPTDAEEHTDPGDDPYVGVCLAEIQRLGYRLQATYHPASRFWPFQWYEAGIYTALALGLAGFCSWQIRRRPS
jgi:ABC-type transport system involved in multi-copper enzyme maturation permease subunit